MRANRTSFYNVAFSSLSLPVLDNKSFFNSLHNQIYFKLFYFFPKLFFRKLLFWLFEFEFISFSVNVHFPKSFSEVEKKFIRTNIQSPLIRVLESKKKFLNFSNPEFSILLDYEKEKVFLNPSSVYIYGKYVKLSRDLAQTFHFCPKCKGRGCSNCVDGKISASSVEEILYPLFKDFFCAKQFIFHGAGREDVDVLMLNSGRGFIAEVLFPKIRGVVLSDLNSKINSSNKDVRIFDLKYCSKSDVSLIKNFDGFKIYSALIEADEGNTFSKSDIFDLNNLIDKKLYVAQKTPLRVLKRRSDMFRDKFVIITKINYISDKHFGLELKTSSGTYVKEFISGDNGRTNPSISLYVGPCFCKFLDVLFVESALS